MAPRESSSVAVFRRGAVGRDASTILWLRGEHDASTMDSLSDTMARAIVLDDTDLVVDLSEVQFMDAATAELLIRAQEFLAQRSRSLALRSPSSAARRILDLCGRADLLDPLPADAMRMTGTSGAPGPWVAEPATERAGWRAIASLPKSSGGPDPVRARRAMGARKVSSANAHLSASSHTLNGAGSHTLNGAGREGP